MFDYLVLKIGSHEVSLQIDKLPHSKSRHISCTVACPDNENTERFAQRILEQMKENVQKNLCWNDHRTLSSPLIHPCFDEQNRQITVLQEFMDTDASHFFHPHAVLSELAERMFPEMCISSEDDETVYCLARPWVHTKDIEEDALFQIAHLSCTWPMPLDMFAPLRLTLLFAFPPNMTVLREQLTRFFQPISRGNPEFHQETVAELVVTVEVCMQRLNPTTLARKLEAFLLAELSGLKLSCDNE